MVNGITFHEIGQMLVHRGLLGVLGIQGRGRNRGKAQRSARQGKLPQAPALGAPPPAATTIAVAPPPQSAGCQLPAAPPRALDTPLPAIPKKRRSRSRSPRSRPHPTPAAQPSGGPTAQVASGAPDRKATAREAGGSEGQRPARSPPRRDFNRGRQWGPGQARSAVWSGDHQRPDTLCRRGRSASPPRWRP